MGFGINDSRPGGYEGKEESMSAYDKALKALAEEYERVWDIADAEKKQTGKVSEETENALIAIENEMAMLENAV